MAEVLNLLNIPTDLAALDDVSATEWRSTRVA